MSVEDLIGRLVRDAGPVVRPGRPGVQFARWSVIASFYLAAGVLMIGAREGLEEMWRAPGFVLHTAFVFGVTVLAAAAAFDAGIPDRRQSRLANYSAIAMAAWLAWIISTLVTASEPHAGYGWKCLRNIVVLTVPLGALTFCMMSKAAPLRTRTAGWLAALSAAAAADLATRFICRNDHALHALIWHFIPTLALGGAGVALGRMVFRWDGPIRTEARRL